MKKISRTPLAATIGAAFISTFAATAVYAEANPFGITELSTGYMQVAEAKEAGEMKCGAAMPNMTKAKTPEGACAGSIASKNAHKTEKAAEGKCGEAKCGAMMQDGKMKKGMEAVCGGMMKGKEGACGAMGAAGAAAADAKTAEGKCGEACGDQMKACADAKTKEGACGAKMKGCGEGMQGCVDMMKGKEGACGAGMKMSPPPAVAPSAPAAPVTEPAAPAH